MFFKKKLFLNSLSATFILLQTVAVIQVLKAKNYLFSISLVLTKPPTNDIHFNLSANPETTVFYFHSYSDFSSTIKIVENFKLSYDSSIFANDIDNLSAFFNIIVYLPRHKHSNRKIIRFISKLTVHKALKQILIFQVHPKSIVKNKKVLFFLQKNLKIVSIERFGKSNKFKKRKLAAITEDFSVVH